MGTNSHWEVKSIEFSNITQNNHKSSSILSHGYRKEEHFWLSRLGLSELKFLLFTHLTSFSILEPVRQYLEFRYQDFWIPHGWFDQYFEWFLINYYFYFISINLNNFSFASKIKLIRDSDIKSSMQSMQVYKCNILIPSQKWATIFLNIPPIRLKMIYPWYTSSNNLDLMMFC